MPDPRFEQRKQEFMVNPPIHTMLPIKFDNGHEVTKFEFECASCNQQVAKAHIRGNVTRWGRNRITIAGDGFCADCRKLLRFDIRISQAEKGALPEYVYRCSRTRRWQSLNVRPQRQSITAQLIRLIKGLFTN